MVDNSEIILFNLVLAAVRSAGKVPVMFLLHKLSRLLRFAKNAKFCAVDYLCIGIIG